MTIAVVKTPFREANIRLMRESFERLGRRLVAGEIGLLAFREAMAEELYDGVVAGYRFARGRALSEVDEVIVDDILRYHYNFLDNFVNEIALDNEGAMEARIPGRAAMYAVAGVEADARGRLSTTAGFDQIRWIAVDDPKTCATCHMMAGVHTRTDLEGRGIMPGHGTDCGPNCRCYLEVV